MALFQVRLTYFNQSPLARLKTQVSTTGYPTAGLALSQSFNENIVVYLCSCVLMSHFGRDLNQSGDGLPCCFQMFICRVCSKRDGTITSQVAIIINYYM